VTVGGLLGLLANSHLREEILKFDPYIEHEDITQALGYAAPDWRGTLAGAGESVTFAERVRQSLSLRQNSKSEFPVEP
jgi:hypothetical protein